MEKFIKIKGWEDFYEISNLGKIKCLNYLHHKGKIYISSGIKNNNGYYKYELKNKGNKKVFLIHRLVAIHFIPNPYNYPCVNHINGNKSDNRVINLEWCTYKQNNNHAFKLGFYRNKQIPFAGTNIKTGERIEFINIQDAAIMVNGNRANIHKCLTKKYNRTIAYGYKWEYTHVSNNILSKIPLPI